MTYNNDIAAQHLHPHHHPLLRCKAIHPLQHKHPIAPSPRHNIQTLLRLHHPSQRSHIPSLVHPAAGPAPRQILVHAHDVLPRAHGAAAPRPRNLSTSHQQRRRRQMAQHQRLAHLPKPSLLDQQLPLKPPIRRLQQRHHHRPDALAGSAPGTETAAA